MQHRKHHNGWIFLAKYTAWRQEPLTKINFEHEGISVFLKSSYEMKTVYGLYMYEMQIWIFKNYRNNSKVQASTFL